MSLLSAGGAFVKVIASAADSASVGVRVAILSVAESLLAQVNAYGPVQDIRRYKNNLLAQQSAKTRGMHEENIHRRVQSIQTVADAINKLNSAPPTSPLMTPNQEAIGEANRELLQLLSRLSQHGGSIFVDGQELERITIAPSNDAEASGPLPAITGQSVASVGISAGGAGTVTPPTSSIGPVNSSPIGDGPIG